MEVSLRTGLLRAYWRCEKVIAPRLQYSQYQYRDRLLPLIQGKDRWLEIGCGHQLFAEWMRADQQKAIGSCRVAFGCDLDFEGLKKHPDLLNKCMASGYGLPYASGSMEIVSANMVMEHVDKPREFLNEVYRVLRPGGLFVFHTPNRRGYRTVCARLVTNQKLKTTLVRLLENREEDDVFPTFYRLNDPESIAREAAGAKLQVQSIDSVETSAILSSMGPVAIPELLVIRMLQQKWAMRYRATLIAVLRRPVGS
jgi:ubiquinone/menaquinone biosynthesis C-methylase UbiE